MTVGETMAAELQRLHETFAPDELAYLALTSKVELVVRDRLAFRLHLRFAADGDFVVREWRRTDLAVLRRGMPILLLELKAMYSFDARSSPTLRKYREAVGKDCRKALALAAPETDVYTLLLVTHPQANCGSELDEVVKYRARIEQAAAAGITVVRDGAVQAIASVFQGEPVALRDTFRGGTAFDIPVSVDYWLFGPYRGSRLTAR